MKTKLITGLFAACLVLLAEFAGAQVLIRTDTVSGLLPIGRGISGANNNLLTDQLTYQFNADTTHIDSTYFNEGYIGEVQNLRFSRYRFPGGTVGNYFHFYGTGMGFDSLEYECRPGYFTMPYIQGIQPIDKKVNYNFIRDYVRFIRQVEAADAQPVGSYILINLHTHLYRKQLQFANPALSQQLTDRFGLPLLVKKLRDTDSGTIQSSVTGLRELLADPQFAGIKDSLLQDPGFRLSFSENMAMLRYLRANNISLRGVELGNETFSEYFLFDDDLGALGFDCTNAPPNAAKTFDSLRLGDYFEGLLKYWILSTVYADSIRQAFDLPVGVPAALPFTYILFDSNRQPYSVSPFNDLYKQAMLWNGFLFRETRYDAMIPHFYSQRFIPCDSLPGTLSQIEPDSLYLLSARLMHTYPELILEKQFRLLQRYGENKTFWITEWNFNQYSFVSNTFLHNYFIDHVIRKAIAIESEQRYPVDGWCFHSLAGDYFRYAIIKTTSGTTGFDYHKMVSYDIFEMWNKTLEAGVKKLPYTSVQLSGNTDTLVHLDLFINAAQDTAYLHFSNPEPAGVSVSLDSLRFMSGAQQLDVALARWHIFDAGSPVSNNETCSELSGTGSDESFTVTRGSADNPDVLWLPAYSIGKFTLGLKQALSAVTEHTGSLAIRIFPNPTTGILKVQLPNPGHAVYDFTVTDAPGMIQLQGNWNSGTPGIDVSALPAGMYILTLRARDGQAGTVKVIKL